MFLGHFGLGFAGKRIARSLSLGTLFLSVQLADLLWPVFLLLGYERVRIVPGITTVSPLDFEWYPITHSLVGLIGWGVLFGLVYLGVSNWRPGAWVVGLGVVSHWVLDAASHRPDVPVFPNGPYVGLGLWNSLPATLLVELAIFGIGLAVYLRTTRARDAYGRWSLVALVVFLIGAYLGSVFGPPPPGPRPSWPCPPGCWSPGCTRSTRTGRLIPFDSRRTFASECVPYVRVPPLRGVKGKQVPKACAVPPL